MGSGEQVIMVMNLPLLETYEHIPSGFFTFIKEHCLIDDGKELINPIVKRSEYAFIDQAIYSERSHIVRNHIRRSGGTTLLSLLGLYLSISHSANVVMVSTHGHSIKHWIDTVMRFRLNSHTMTIKNNMAHAIIVKNMVDFSETVIRFLHLNTNLVYDLRGYRDLCVILDGPDTTLDHRKILDSIMEVVQISGPNAKIIENRESQAHM